MKHFKNIIHLLTGLLMAFFLQSCYTQFSPPRSYSDAPRETQYQEEDRGYSDTSDTDSTEYYGDYDDEYYQGDIADAGVNDSYFYDDAPPSELSLYDRDLRDPYEVFYSPDVHITIRDYSWYDPFDYYYGYNPYRYGYYTSYYNAYGYYNPWYVVTCPPLYWGYYDPYWYPYGYGFRHHPYYGGYGHHYGGYGYDHGRRSNFDYKRRDWNRRDSGSLTARPSNRGTSVGSSGGGGERGSNPYPVVQSGGRRGSS
ncbi:MAG: hypothetical protein KDH97_16655, partial [Calditrichaeota bacterium]|nr:hypothetical protein [Calditrichota bacterium]